MYHHHLYEQIHYSVSSVYWPAAGPIHCNKVTLAEYSQGRAGSSPRSRNSGSESKTHYCWKQINLSNMYQVFLQLWDKVQNVMQGKVWLPKRNYSRYMELQNAFHKGNTDNFCVLFKCVWTLMLSKTVVTCVKADVVKIFFLKRKYNSDCWCGWTDR